jgi:hypothetical protein
VIRTGVVEAAAVSLDNRHKSSRESMSAERYRRAAASGLELAHTSD